MTMRALPAGFLVGLLAGATLACGRGQDPQPHGEDALQEQGGRERWDDIDNDEQATGQAVQ